MSNQPELPYEVTFRDKHSGFIVNSVTLVAVNAGEAKSKAAKNLGIELSRKEYEVKAWRISQTRM